MFKNIIIASFLYMSIDFGYSQSSKTFKEIGVMAGPVFFQSDYGESGKFENYIDQNGFSIGVFYYLAPTNSKNIGKYLTNDVYELIDAVIVDEDKKQKLQNVKFAKAVNLLF